MDMWRRFGRPAALLIITIATGCGSADRLAAPIATFRTTAASVATISRPYFVELNQVERHVLFNDAMNDPQLDVDDRFIRPTFSAEGIRARLDALQLIDAYTQRLADIAGSDASTRLRTTTEGLGKNLTSLVGRIDKASGEDSKIGAYAGPVTALAGFVQELWIEHQRMKALRVATEQAAPRVREILDLIESDLLDAHGARASAMLIEYANLRVAYNRDKQTLADAVRRQRLGELEQLANHYERLTSLAPAAGVAEMRNAHEALVVAARDARSIKSFNDFVTAVELFSIRVDQAATIARQIEDAR